MWNFGSSLAAPSIMGLILYSRFGASRRCPLPTPMSISRFLSAVNGSSALKSMNILTPLRRRGNRAEKRLVLVYLRRGSGTDACRMSASTGHLAATCSSIPMKRLPMPTNATAGMARSPLASPEGMPVAPALPGCYSEPWRSLDTAPPQLVVLPRRCAVSGRCPREAECVA